MNDENEFVQIARMLNDIARASGALEKKALLQKYGTNSTFKNVLKFVYDPYHKCGLGSNKLDKALRSVNPIKGTTDVLQVIIVLLENNTGTDYAASYAAAFVNAVSQKYYGDVNVYDIACDIVTQSLKLGVSTKTLNSVYGSSFIPTVGCMLGTLYSDVKAPQWPCIATEKLDGIRRILIKENGVCRMFSRSGHEDTGCVDILKEAKYLPDNHVYDGEMTAKGTFVDNIALRQATSSIMNSKGDKHGVVLKLFDMLTLEEFYSGTSMKAIDRKIVLAATFKDDSLQHLTDDWAQLQVAFGVDHTFEHIVTVPIIGLFNNLDEVTPHLTAIWDRHGEGIMLNSVNGRYEIKRSTQLMKLKFSTEVTLPVIGFKEGKDKYAGSLGALLVDYKGSIVGVGSGFTDEERQVIWDNQTEFLGKRVEIETFGESKNATGGISLNVPIFKRFVGGE